MQEETGMHNFCKEGVRVDGCSGKGHASHLVCQKPRTGDK